MKRSYPATADPRIGGDETRRAIKSLPDPSDLIAALERETGIIHELREALVQQRAGVASSDTGAVDASVDSIGRILHALGEARRTRTRLVANLSGDDSTSLLALEARLGGALPEPLALARHELKNAAFAVAHEVTVNRVVLRRAVEAGEAFLQALFSSANPVSPVYHSGDRLDESGPTSGVLLNRKA